jgi:hypothetical protein
MKVLAAVLILALAAPAFAAPPGDPRPSYSHEPVVECTEDFCLHYVAEGPDAIEPADENSNGTPDLAELMIDELTRAWEAEIDRDGFVSPLPDDPTAGHGPNELPDVYVQSGGSFVASDGPADDDTQSAWMGLHSSFSDVIPGVPAEVLLRDTVPHELLHMIQCAYDCGEPDAMIGEGTAVWMADRVYEATGDDIGVTLEWTSLVHPELPIDGSGGTFGPGSTTGNGSGSWLFFRFLSERLGGSGSDAGIVRQIWEAAAQPGTFSLEAIDGVATVHGSSFVEMFSEYAVANYTPAESYEQGAAYVQDAGLSGFELHPEDAVHRFKKRVRKASGELEVDHLAMAYTAFLPRKKGKPKDLVLSAEAAPGIDTAAVALTVTRSGRTRTRSLDLSGAPEQLGFSRKKVKRVVLVLVNASTAYACGATTEPTPCFGVPLDDDIVFSYSARLE